MDKLVEQAKKGNIESFSFLIENIQVELYNIAKIKINNEDDINDVLQDTIIDIYNGLKKLKDNKLFKTWSIRILLNNCNSLLRNKYKIKNIISFEEYEQKYNSANNKEIIEEKCLNLDFENIVSILSEQEKIIFVMFYQEDYQIKEISEILKINNNTVKSILKRGREKIKENFKELNSYE